VQYLAPEFQPIPTVPVPGEALLPGPRADIPPANTVASVYAAAPMTPSQKRSGAGPKRHEFHDRRTGEIVLMTVEEGAENPRRYVDPGNVLFLHDTKTGMVVEGVKELIKQQFPGDEDEIEPAVFEVVAELAEAYLRRTDMTSQQAVRKAVSDLKEGGVFSDPGYLTTNEIGIDPKWVPRLSKLFEQWAEQTARNFSKAGGQ